MKYTIMIIIVIGMVAADFLTGLIKAFVKEDVCSSKMRKGGLNKICELIVMLSTCGLEIGIEMLGQYHQAAELAAIAGAVAAGLVFGYIVLMEMISILENYSEINPDASWVRVIIKKLRKINPKEEVENDDTV